MLLSGLIKYGKLLLGTIVPSIWKRLSDERFSSLLTRHPICCGRIALCEKVSSIPKYGHTTPVGATAGKYVDSKLLPRGVCATQKAVVGAPHGTLRLPVVRYRTMRTYPCVLRATPASRRIRARTPCIQECDLNRTSQSIIGVSQILGR